MDGNDNKLDLRDRDPHGDGEDARRSRKNELIKSIVYSDLM